MVLMVKKNQSLYIQFMKLCRASFKQTRDNEGEQ